MVNFRNFEKAPRDAARVIRLSLRGAQPLMVSLSNHVAISLRLSTCRGTIIATATRLPRCARNDKVGTRDAAFVVDTPRETLIY